MSCNGCEHNHHSATDCPPCCSGPTCTRVIPPVDDSQAKTALPTGREERKAIPIVAGCLDYFPAALAAVAEVSRIGNEQHNPGQPLHHARGKSMDHADCIVRHLMDRGTVDTDGVRHAAKVAWRALALLQEELEREQGAPLARGARAAPAALPSDHCKSCGGTIPGFCQDC